MVTEFTFRLHPVPENIYGGLIFFEREAAGDLFRYFDQFIDGKTSRLDAAYDMLLPVSRGLPERARRGRDVRIPKPPQQHDVVINLV